MQVILALITTAAGLLLASFAAVYWYGRFAERAIGAPSAALPVSDSATPLDALAAPLLEKNSGASGMMLVADNLDAFAIRAVAARQAGRSLDLQYYIWANDLSGRLLLHEVIKAADRGVRVRLLLDDINAYRLDRANLALAAHCNIDVRLFNPSRNRDGALARGIEMLLRAVRINRRMHNKAWIADGRLAVVGGRNIGDAYFDAAELSNFRDLDIALFGPAVGQTETIFDRFWNSKEVIPITALGKRREGDLQRLRRKLAILAAGKQAKPYLERVVESDTVRRMLSGKSPVHWSKDVEVVSDPPEKANAAGEDNWLIHAILPVLTSATSDLEIISPYFIPGKNGTGRFAAAVADGVRVSVLTNSLAATDVAAVHGAYIRYRRPLLEGGINLFELKPYDRKSSISLIGSSSASLHTKSFTVDDRAGFIGSMNFDPRSVSLNTEMGALFAHAGLVREIRTVFADETSTQKSYRVVLRNGKLGWEDRTKDTIRLLKEEPRAGFWRRAIATLISCLPVESQL